MLHIPGGPALSSFRTEKLLARARGVVPDIEAIHSEYWHFADLEQQLDARDRATGGDIKRDFNFTPFAVFGLFLRNGLCQFTLCNIDKIAHNSRFPFILYERCHHFTP